MEFKNCFGVCKEIPWRLPTVLRDILRDRKASHKKYVNLLCEYKKALINYMRCNIGGRYDLHQYDWGARLKLCECAENIEDIPRNVSMIYHDDVILEKYIKKGDICGVKYALYMGCRRIIFGKKFGFLILSVEFNQYDVCEYLLENRIEVPDSKGACLYWAIKNKNLRMCSLLLNYGSGIDNNTLTFAVESGCFSICSLLLQRGADVHALDDKALRVADQRGYYDICELLLDYGANPYASSCASLYDLNGLFSQKF